jgi:hypothetical protein
MIVTRIKETLSPRWFVLSSRFWCAVFRPPGTKYLTLKGNTLGFQYLRNRRNLSLKFALLILVSESTTKLILFAVIESFICGRKWLEGNHAIFSSVLVIIFAAF